jgi:hypothetical protein
MFLEKKWDRRPKIRKLGKKVNKDKQDPGCREGKKPGKRTISKLGGGIQTQGGFLIETSFSSFFYIK